MNTDSDNGIIHAYTIEGDGSGKPLSGKAISEKIKCDSLAWVHLDIQNPGTRTWLEREVSYLDNIVLDALLAEETRPRILDMGQGALLILRGMNLNENEEPEDMVSIRLWVDAHRIISLRRRKLKAVMDIKEQLEKGTGPKNAGEFITALTSRLFERMEPVLTMLDEQIDNIEERVMENPDVGARREIVDIRKQAIMFRRYIAPQRDVIATLRSSDIPCLDIQNKRRLQETLERIVRYVEDLDTARERAQIVKDELANALSDRLNKNMYVLSVVAAIFLPLGFLTGLLGINVGGIPGADNPEAFTIFMVMLAGIVFAQVALFKKMKWF